MTTVNPLYREVEQQLTNEELIQVPKRLKTMSADNDTKIFMPKKSMVAHVDPHSVFEIQCSNLRSNFLQNPTPYQTFIIPAGCMNFMRPPVAFRLNVTGTANDDIAPTPFWFQYYEIVPNAGSGQAIRRNYADTMFFEYGLFNAYEDLHGYCKVLGFPISWQSPGSTGSFRRDANSNYIRANTAKNFYLLMDSGFWSDMGIFIANLSKDLWINFYPSGSITYTNGGTANITCNQFALITPTDIMTDRDRENHIAFINQGIFGYNFLDVSQIKFPSTSINASTTVSLSLSALVGKVAFMLLTFRPSATTLNATNDAYITTLTDPGDDCTFDIVNAGGSSMWSYSTAPRSQYLRYVASKSFPGPIISDLPIVPIVFSQDVECSIKGKINSFMQFNGQTDRNLQITFGPVGVNEVQTITFTGGAPAAGAFTFFFRGEVSASFVAADTVATLATRFNSMQSARRAGLTATFGAGAAFNTNGTLVVTFSPMQPVNDFLYVLGGPGAAITTMTGATYAITTAGVSGCPVSVATNYDINLNAYVHRDNFMKEKSYVSALS